jgi:hypothetical protein
MDLLNALNEFVELANYSQFSPVVAYAARFHFSNTAIEYLNTCVGPILGFVFRLGSVALPTLCVPRFNTPGVRVPGMALRLVRI